MTLREMQEKRAQVLKEARERLDEIDSNTDESRAAELETQHDAAMAEMDALDVKIKRWKDQENREAAHARDEEERANAEQRQRENRRPDTGSSQEPAAGGGEEPEYDAVFRHYIQHGVEDLSSEERNILREGRYVSVGGEQRAQGTTTDPAGGFTVPEGFVNEIDQAMAIWGPMWDANIVRELNTGTGNNLPWPTIDDTDGRGRKKTQNDAVNDDGNDDMVFGRKQLSAYVYDTGLVRIPLELLTDSAFNMEALLDDLFAERMGRTANEVLTTGSGTDEPHGIVTGSTLGKTSAATQGIASDEYFDLFHSVDAAYRQSPKCRWMFNDATLNATRKLKDGQGNYLWQMGDVRTNEPDRLLSKPYSVNQAMDDIGAGNKPIVFGDFSRFVVRKVNGFTLMTLRERYAEYFQIGMVGFKRFDSRLINASAVKHLQNAAT